jgi:flagellar biogenesis protein FliO
MQNFIYLATTAIFPTQEQSISEIMPSYENAFLKMFITLIILLVATFAIIWLLKRFSRTGFSQNYGKSIKILERKQLSPKTTLYIVEIEEKKTIIAESQLEVKQILTPQSTKDEKNEIM